jgi:hypothetical protein
MIETYALTKEGSEFPIEIGSIAHCCSLWGELKYRNAPDEKYSISKIQITTVFKLIPDEIGNVLDKIYEWSDNQ